MSEKELVFRAVPCQKIVLRLLKEDAAVLEQKVAGTLPICSYYLKTVVLHMADTKGYIWTVDISNTRLRYLDAIKLLIGYLQRKNIPHYFIKDDNLLALDNFEEKDFRKCISFFTDNLTKYSVV